MKQSYIKEEQHTKDNYKNEATGKVHAQHEIPSKSPGKTCSAEDRTSDQAGAENQNSGKIMHDIFGAFNY